MNPFDHLNLKKPLRLMIKGHKIFDLGHVHSEETLMLCTNCYCMTNNYVLYEGENLSIAHCAKCLEWIEKPGCSRNLRRMVVAIIKS